MQWTETIGRSVRGTYNIPSLLLAGVYVYVFIPNCAPQPPHLSGHPRRRTRAVARDLAAALGVRHPPSTRGAHIPGRIRRRVFAQAGAVSRHAYAETRSGAGAA